MDDREADHGRLGPLQINGRSLTLNDVEVVARSGQALELAPGCIERMEAAQRAIAVMLSGDAPVYGVNTGFGALSTMAISHDDVRELQHNLLRSHAAGSGDLLPDEVVRAVLLVRANSLARGYSGVRPVVVQRMIDLLNAGITPAIPAQGSLGASGDLAPLAHLGLVLTGEGYVVSNGGVAPAAEALADAGIEPLVLGPKEALAIINGTAVIAALATLALLDAERLMRSAIVVAALSSFAVGALREPFDARLHAVRRHPGQVAVAALLRETLGALGADHREAARIQDPYSIRCLPPVYGAAIDALKPLRGALETEVNAATDNPLIFPDEVEALSGANFHGHPLALPVEYGKVAIASVGTMVERRIALLVDAGEYGLPTFLVANPGLNSGYMIAHYLAAALVAENRVLAHPAAVDSIPTSANIEDFNSMGTISARHLREITANVERIVAVEALCAAQACDLRGIQPDGVLESAYEMIRSLVPKLERDDRMIAEDVEAAGQLVHRGDLAGLLEVRGTIG